MVYCDKNDNILEWASEEIAIPYRSPVDNRVHRYFPDFYMKVKERGGKVKRYVIEVKPAKQTKPPVKPKRQTKGYIRKHMNMQRTKLNGRWHGSSVLTVSVSSR